MSNDLMWRTASRVHDWTDRAFLVRLLAQAVALGIIDKVDWVSNAVGGERRSLPVKARGSLPERLLGTLRANARPGYLEAGGDGDRPWRLHLLLPRMDRSGLRLDGMSVAALQFDGQPFDSPAGSARLSEAFTGMHTPSDTEYAGLHWQTDWQRLKSTTYRNAVTYDPMFSGLVWANFLGPCHIDQFDANSLRGLPQQCCHWLGDQGLFFMAEAALNEVRNPVAEQELARQTEVFREARVRSINPGVPAS